MKDFATKIILCTFLLSGTIPAAADFCDMNRQNLQKRDAVTEGSFQCNAGFYAVDDQGSRNSQLVYVTGDSRRPEVTDIGSTHKNLDIEGIDFNPKTGVLYAIGGEKNKANQQNLYIWDTKTGDLTDLGTIGGEKNPFNKKDLVAASFRNDSTFWVSVEGMGLYTVDLDDMSATLQSDDKIFTKGTGAEGIAWDPTGETLFLSKGNQIYSWDPDSPDTFTTYTAGGGCKIPGNIEALGFVEGQLLAGGSTKVFGIELNGTGNYSAVELYQSPGRDFESLAGTASTPVPEPATLALIGLGGSLTLYRRRIRKIKRA